MIKYILRLSKADHHLWGSNPYELAVIEQWLAWTQNTWFAPFHQVVWPLYGVIKYIPEKYSAALKEIKGLAKKLDNFLKGRKYIGGDHMSFTDIYLTNVFKYIMQTVFDQGFRKAIPSLTEWYVRMTEDPLIVKRFGKCKLCAKALKPVEDHILKVEITKS